MPPVGHQLSAAGLANRIFNERKLGEVLGGSDARRYGLVNRALKDGSLVRVKRGTYMLGRQYQSELVHPFAVAQALVPGSYVSFESALAYHGWIPEAVLVTASVTPGRKSLGYETTGFGPFRYHPLAIQDYGFLVGVDRVPVGKITAFVAQPLRALMDLVAQRKQAWTGTAWLTEGLRIDEDQLLGVRAAEFRKLKKVYKHKAANVFLTNFESAVMDARQTRNRKPVA